MAKFLASILANPNLEEYTKKKIIIIMDLWMPTYGYCFIIYKTLQTILKWMRAKG